MSPAPAQVWWTADEIAAAALPDMPGTKRRVNALADRLNWRMQEGLSRRRSGRGGGWEYHWSLFPARAQARLLQSTASKPPIDTPLSDRESAWAWFEAQPGKVKLIAQDRLSILHNVDALTAPRGRHQAVVDVAAMSDVSVRTIWNWLGLVEGQRADDWLPFLAPRHRAVARAASQADIDPAFFEALKSDYLRPAAPSFTSCYRRAVMIARKNQWAYPPERTARRRFDAEVSAPTRVLARKGGVLQLELQGRTIDGAIAQTVRVGVVG